jgi:hypothetical protein
MSNLLDAAHRYAARGLPVFPLWPVLPFKYGVTCGCGRGTRCESPGKHPLGTLVPNGLKSATTDNKMITDWWAARPNANIGVATGDVVVIDIDPRHGGDAALGRLEEKHGKFPPTWPSAPAAVAFTSTCRRSPTSRSETPPANLATE